MEVNNLSSTAKYKLLVEFWFISAIIFSNTNYNRIFLAMHYAAHIDLAFLSVEHIMRDVNSG